MVLEREGGRERENGSGRTSVRRLGEGTYDS